jgi:hypothetical protein
LHKELHPYSIVMDIYDEYVWNQSDDAPWLNLIPPTPCGPNMLRVQELFVTKDFFLYKWNKIGMFVVFYTTWW